MLLIRLILVVVILVASSANAQQNQIYLESGVDSAGVATGKWLEYNAKGELVSSDLIPHTSKKFTTEELAWKELILSRTNLWQTQLEQIAVPFKSIKLPRKLTVVVGNRGGNDAFANPTRYPFNIYFNLSLLARSYGNAKSEKNIVRIDRIFAHEYTHLLQHQRSINNPYKLNSPLERALVASYKEGFGHFRSISNKWRTEQGEITAHSEKALLSLEKVFVDRITALNGATDEQADSLMKGLSTGPFNKKWGALTVALWLVKESNGDDTKLIKWVDLGPQGVLILANKYLPKDLQLKLKSALG